MRHEIDDRLRALLERTGSLVPDNRLTAEDVRESVAEFFSDLEEDAAQHPPADPDAPVSSFVMMDGDVTRPAQFMLFTVTPSVVRFAAGSGNTYDVQRVSGAHTSAELEVALRAHFKITEPVELDLFEVRTWAGI